MLHFWIIARRWQTTGCQNRSPGNAAPPNQPTNPLTLGEIQRKEFSWLAASWQKEAAFGRKELVHGENWWINLLNNNSIRYFSFNNFLKHYYLELLFFLVSYNHFLRVLWTTNQWKEWRILQWYICFKIKTAISNSF